MARRLSSRRSARPARRARVARAAPRRSSRRISGARRRRAAAARNSTVRVVIQQAPSPVASPLPGAVSMTTLKKARF